MRQVILDTSFILTCVRQKIDFFYWLRTEDIKPIIPEQVLSELAGLGVELALKIINMNNFELAKIPGKDADAAIINFTKENPEVIVATLDKGLKKKIKNRKLVIRQKKKLEII